MPPAPAKKTPTAGLRTLIEAYQATGADGSKLKIDRDNRVVYGVKVLGRYSRNNHGVREAENGTEYTPACLRAALPLIEGAKAFGNHPADRTRPGVERDALDGLGVFRNARVESEDDGARADLHYLTEDDPLTRKMLADIERGVGVYGFSPNQASDRERIDRQAGRLVIESIALVRSVDLVTRPATNRNLWESEETPPMKVTIKSLLESQAQKYLKSPPRAAWLRTLLEDDMAPIMAAEVDAPADSDDPLWTGVRGAAIQILDDESMDAAAKIMALKKLLTAHEKLSDAAEPEPPAEEEPEDDKPADKTESLADLKAENAKLKRESSCRTLCESEGFTPKATQLKALVLLESDAERKELIGSFKAAATQPRPGDRPRSVAPGSRPKATPTRDLTESEQAAADVRTLRG